MKANERITGILSTVDLDETDRHILRILQENAKLNIKEVAARKRGKLTEQDRAGTPRPWLGPLIAIAANSPFLDNVDTGWDSSHLYAFGAFVDVPVRGKNI